MDLTMAVAFGKMFVFYLCFKCVSGDKISPEVSIKYGNIRGSVVTSQGVSTTVNQFLGIPFAEPPLGSLRFQKPIKWTKQWSILNATRWPNVCPQPLGMADLMGMDFLGPQSEDCLYLNIWTSTHLPTVSESQLKSVLVFIHGGCFFGGSSSFPVYDGTKLSFYGDIVVVTFNYRLGVLGFLTAGDENAPGNVGLWDQLLALQWIQENIKAFGGDPRKVTISGESAGSMSISLYLTSNLTQTLFDKAFLMSGVGVDEFLSTSVSTAINRTNLLAQILGCNDSDRSSAQLDCLKKVNVQALIEAQFHKSLIFFEPEIRDSFVFRPTYGDQLLPMPPISAILKNHVQNRKILIGTVVNEGILYTTLAPNTAISENTSVVEAAEKLSTVVKNIKAPKTVLKEKIQSHYFTSYSFTMDSYFKSMTEILFTCPTLFLAEAFSMSNLIYSYLFAVQSNRTFLCTKGGLKPCHGDDLFFLFGNSIESELDVKNSEAWMDIVLSFVKDKNMDWSTFETFKNQPSGPVYIFRGKKGNELSNDHQFKCQIWKEFYF